MSKKTSKHARAQRPSGASTSAEHPAPEAQRRKGPGTATIIGASLLALGAGALIALTRQSWPIKAAKRAATGRNESAGSGDSNGSVGVDAELNAEVAGATQSTPKGEASFTDEGATGNND